MVVEELKAGRRIVGTMIRMIGNPGVASIAKNAGLDFIMLDMEHGVYSLETVSAVMATARASGLGGFVRVPELAKGYVSRVLDAGATGVMVPMIESVEQAAKLAAWSKFAPVGQRGLGSAGVHTAYTSADAVPFMEQSNREILTIAQIETGPAIEAIDQIAKVDGIDALLIGPNDLAISLGVPGQTTSGPVAEAIGKVANACKATGKIFGMHGSPALLETWMPKGMNLVMHSLDIAMLQAGMKAIAERYSNG